MDINTFDIAKSDLADAGREDRPMRTEANSPVVLEKEASADFVAVGGGLSGVCAALAAARRGDAANPLRESSGSQFYIVQDPRTCAQLDGQYTVFGETIEGLEVIDKIAGVDTDPRDCPLSPVKIVKVELVK